MAATIWLPCQDMGFGKLHLPRQSDINSIQMRKSCQNDTITALINLGDIHHRPLQLTLPSFSCHHGCKSNTLPCQGSDRWIEKVDALAMVATLAGYHANRRASSALIDPIQTHHSQSSYHCTARKIWACKHSRKERILAMGYNYSLHYVSWPK